MDIKAACEQLAHVLTAGEASRDARFRAARQLVVDQCLMALGRELRSGVTVAAAIRMVAETNDRSAQRDCAVLIIHALAVPGLKRSISLPHTAQSASASPIFSA